MFNRAMSAEKIINIKKEDTMSLGNTKASIKKSSGRVDINNLFARVREQKNKENRINFIFFFNIYFFNFYSRGYFFSLNKI